MRIKELFHPKLLIALTNEETQFLAKHRERRIDLASLEPRESRIAENLIYKDILYKISHNEAMVKEYVSVSKQGSS